jgi:hypothetical protein
MSETALSRCMSVLSVAVAVSAIAGQGITTAANAAAPIPISEIPFAQRQQGCMPDSTAVTIGKRTTTLGQLRAAHLAREQSRNEANAKGAEVKQILANTQDPAATHPLPGSPTSSTGVIAVPEHGIPPGAIETGQPPSGLRNANPGVVMGAMEIVEPPSAYATARTDMKAFCSNAAASACMFVPPGQTYLYVSYGISGQGSPQLWDPDELLDETTCVNEGGGYSQPQGCIFFYPVSCKANFTPVAPYLGTTTAQCDQTIWTYYVDFHQGLITVQIQQQLMGGPDPDHPGLNQPGPDFTSGAAPWWAIHVYPHRTP